MHFDISTDQMDLMKRMAPQFINQIKTTGMVNYTDIIVAGILPGTTSKDRDNLCHNHQGKLSRMDEAMWQEGIKILCRKCYYL